ncbi:MAG TPA: rhodanese-like domain-containing protein [Gemmatimonadales bacterium]|nr:rhodanese-like domain-containing protein [Gemmatimonadales bacterium]
MTRCFRSLTPLVALAAAAAPLAAQAPALPPLVSAAWLADHLQDPRLVLLQVGRDSSYAREHIAGSRFVRLRDLGPREPDGLALEMPAPDSLEAGLERLGISNDSRVVVVFSDEWITASTRVLYTLAYAGLGDHAALLDGGLPAWKRAGGPVTDRVPPPGRGRVQVRIAPSLIVDYAWVEAHERAPHVRLVDARSGRFYSGPAHEGMPGGHIPGAVSIALTSVADDSVLMLAPADLAQRFREAGVEPGDTVVAYCHIGQQATLVLFGARLTGHPVRLYDGSMEDWGNRKLPTEGVVQ